MEKTVDSKQKPRDYMRGQCVVCGNMRKDAIRSILLKDINVRVDVCWWPDAIQDCHSTLVELGLLELIEEQNGRKMGQ